MDRLTSDVGKLQGLADALMARVYAAERDVDLLRAERRVLCLCLTVALAIIALMGGWMVAR